MLVELVDVALKVGIFEVLGIDLPEKEAGTECSVLDGAPSDCSSIIGG